VGTLLHLATPPLDSQVSVVHASLSLHGGGTAAAWARNTSSVLKMSLSPSAIR
jgi:hypothetical protein